MIIVVRGTNGSGKSYVMRQILAYGRRVKRTMPEQSSLLCIRGVSKPAIVIGPYIDGRSMGGCDCIRQPSKIYEIIEHAMNMHWHVLLEGVVLATKPYLEYYQSGHDVRYAFLDPPQQRCLQNIAERQRLKGHASRVSEEAMDGKRVRAHLMFIRAREHGMITQRFTDANETVKWVLYQLRHPR